MQGWGIPQGVLFPTAVKICLDRKIQHPTGGIFLCFFFLSPRKPLMATLRTLLNYEKTRLSAGVKLNRICPQLTQSSMVNIRLLTMRLLTGVKIISRQIQIILKLIQETLHYWINRWLCGGFKKISQLLEEIQNRCVETWLRIHKFQLHSLQAFVTISRRSMQKHYEKWSNEA